MNVLGREVTAQVANFRKVNWRTMGINFVMVFSPNTLKSAPHSHVVTIEMGGGDEAKLLNGMAREFPSVTAVRVKEALATVSELLGKMLGAIRGANALTLLTGIVEHNVITPPVSRHRQIDDARLAIVDRAEDIVLDPQRIHA